MSTVYGIYDTRDKCWLGDEKGPKLLRDMVVNGKPFDALTAAKLCQTVVNEQFRSGFRFRYRVYDGTGNKIKDSITAPITGLQALEQIEARA